MGSFAMGWNEVDALGSMLGGLFGGLAFFVTLYLLNRESRIRRVDELAALRRKEDEDARQARLVFSKISGESYPLNQGLGKLELSGMVFNHSSMPIFNLVVTLEGVGQGRDGFRIVNPGESVEVEMVVRPDTKGPVDLSLPRKVGMTLHFLDGSGRHWRRTGTGQPVRVLEGALSEKVPIERFKPEELTPKTRQDGLALDTRPPGQ